MLVNHRKFKIHCFSEVDSTMNTAKDMAKNGCPNFTVVAAERQIKGRGRLNRMWLSSDGGLYFTVVIRRNLPFNLSFKISFAASIALVKTLREMFGIDAKIKWPNDILVNGKKLAGMLCEMQSRADSDTPEFINVGIGLNVNNDAEQSTSEASSLKNLLGKNISRSLILFKFLDEFENIISGDLENIISEWKKYAVTLHKFVRIVTNYDILEGIAVDIDENGALVLELANGSTTKINYGDCFS